MKRAKEVCNDLGLSPDEFKLHLDYSKMEEMDSGELIDPEDKSGIPVIPPPIDPDLIRSLVQINLDQRTSIDRLVQRLDSLTVGIRGQASASLPMLHTLVMVAMGGIHNTVTVSGGVNLASTGAVTIPTSTTASTVTAGTHRPIAVSQPTTCSGPHTSLSTVPVYTTSASGLYSSTGQYGAMYAPTGANVQAQTNPFWNNMASTSPASVMQTPLTSSLMGLSGDPSTDVMSRGILMRPEYYVQHIDNDIPVRNISHKSMSYNDLVYGMCKVAQFLLLSGGDIHGYMNHMSFITRQARQDCYLDSNFVDYDRIVVNSVIKGETPTFVAGYPLAQSMCFHSANHKSTVGKSKGKWYQNRRSKNVQSDGSNRSTEVCFNYNFKTCDGCERAHICKICRGNHKSPSCPNKDKTTS